MRVVSECSRGPSERELHVAGRTVRDDTDCLQCIQVEEGLLEVIEFSGHDRRAIRCREPVPWRYHRLRGVLARLDAPEIESRLVSWETAHIRVARLTRYQRCGPWHTAAVRR